MQQEAKNLYKLLNKLNLIKPPVIEKTNIIIKESRNWNELEKNWEMLINKGKSKNLKCLLEDFSSNNPTWTEDVTYSTNELNLPNNFAQGDTLSLSNSAIGDGTSDNNSLLLDFVGFIIGGAALISLIGYIYKRYNENSNSCNDTFLPEEEKKDTNLLGENQEQSDSAE